MAEGFCQLVLARFGVDPDSSLGSCPDLCLDSTLGFCPISDLGLDLSLTAAVEGCCFKL